MEATLFRTRTRTKRISSTGTTGTATIGSPSSWSAPFPIDQPLAPKSGSAPWWVAQTAGNCGKFQWATASAAKTDSAPTSGWATRRTLTSCASSVHLAVVQARVGLELADAFKLAFVRPLVLEAVAIHDLHRAEFAEDIARQPDVAVAAAPDAAEQFVIGHLRWANRRRSRGGR